MELSVNQMSRIQGAETQVDKKQREQIQSF